MPPRRRPSAPVRPELRHGVDALDRRIDWADVASRASAGLTRWVLGAGLLSLHVLAFVVVGLGMLLWNILTDPADITVDEPLLRWGIVLAGHAAAVLIGWTIWRVVHPPATVYRPTPRTALGDGRRVVVTAEPVWYPDGAVNGATPGASNGHIPHPPGAWPAPPRTVVTSRRVTTMVVATARDGIASARRRYRRDARTAQPNGTHGPYAGEAPVQEPWAGAAPAQGPTGSLPPAHGSAGGSANGPADGQTTQGDSGWTAETPPTSTWAAASRDEVISVTQVGSDPTSEDDAADPVRSWLDGYLDGKGREREARWTWVEAAASTWLARGELTEPALPAPAQPPATEDGRPADARADPLSADPPGTGQANDGAGPSPA